MARASISGATAPSIAAMVTVSDFVRLSCPSSSAGRWFEPTERGASCRHRLFPRADAAPSIPKRPAHILGSLGASSAAKLQPFRAPAATGRRAIRDKAPRALTRPRRPNAGPSAPTHEAPAVAVSRTISLIHAPLLARGGSRRWCPCVSGNPHTEAVRRQSQFAVDDRRAHDARIWRIDLRTASRKAWLAFSMRCQRSATAWPAGAPLTLRENSCRRDRARDGDLRLAGEPRLRGRGFTIRRRRIGRRRSRSQMIVP